MKLKGTWITALAIAFVATTGVGAYAASPELRDTVGNLITDVQTYAEGEMPSVPKGAVMLNKEVMENSINMDLTTYAEGEMPIFPDSAIRLEAKVIAE